MARPVPVLAAAALFALVLAPTATATWTYVGTCFGHCVETRLTTEDGHTTLWYCGYQIGCGTQDVAQGTDVPAAQDGCRYWRWPGGSLFVCQGES